MTALPCSTIKFYDKPQIFREENFDSPMSRLEDYDYDLPDELIAKQPLPERDSARLLVVNRQTGQISHRQVRDLPELLAPNDCLVVNDTRVVPARLHGKRTATDGRWEGLFLEETPNREWRLMSSTRGKLQEGECVTLLDTHNSPADDPTSEYRLTMLSREDDGIWTARPENDERAFEVLSRFGTVPLPPYIGRDHPTADDRDRYQTVFSRTLGAVAAPTAGLHFTPQLLARCEAANISRVSVTLHVGIGTFRPLTDESFQTGRLHSEWCEISEETATKLNAIRKTDGRVIAIGTTSVRTLESTAAGTQFQAVSKRTDLFIQPPYPFYAIDGMLTNFHLPRSSLLVLVGSYLGMELMKDVYTTAIQERYRFFSYGDAMLIL